MMLTTEEFRPYAETLVDTKGECSDNCPTLECDECPLFEECGYKGETAIAAEQWLKDNPEPNAVPDPAANTPMSHACQLASDHWDYINELLTSHGIPAESRAMCQFHYVSAFIHGYKHAEEEK